jgi:type I thyroxine 5'-deiodinase
VPALNKLHQQYSDRVAFYVVYIQEAHPIDAWQLDDNLQDDVLVASTRTSDERLKVAGLCVTKLGLQLPALVDDPNDTVERAYTGWPDRLYVIDREGRIAYKSAAGPFGFKPAEVEATLTRLLPGAAQGTFGITFEIPRSLSILLKPSRSLLIN